MELKDKIGVWSRDLIDMSKRNTLLYYRESGYRPSGLALPDANPAMLFNTLVRAGRVIEQVALHLPDPRTDPAPLRRLERLRVQARDDLKESGVQTLYMVFGMLDWVEVDYSEERILSPLILVPVTVRQLARGDYSISMVDDEQVEINPSLREKLEHDFHISLPGWQNLITSAQTSSTSNKTNGAAPASPPLVEALMTISAVLKGPAQSSTATWKVSDGVNLGRFSFTKLVMREDLNRNEMTALAHPALRKIAGDRAALATPSGLVRAEQLDERIRPASTLEILDADSSQQEAIQAGVAGQSYVLQGPPGTGKSQTIANIIAESLARGRSVLFVSEKMAALDVVRKRLTDKGLGEFLLDLHDAKRKKKDFIVDLQDTVQRAQDRPRAGSEDSWTRQSGELERRRMQLNSYTRELHKSRFALNISAFRAHGEIARLASAQATSAALANVSSMTSSEFSDRRDALSALLDFSDVLDIYTTHPWRETPLKSLSGEQANALDAHFDRLSGALGSANDAISQLSQRLGEAAPVTLTRAAQVTERVRLALSSPLPPRHWLDPLHAEQLTTMLKYGETAAKAYRDAHQLLDARYRDAVYELDHDTLLAELTESPKPALSLIRTPSSQDPRDQAMRERGELDAHLSACEALLTAIAESSVTAAQLLGIPDPVTLAEVSAVRDQVDVVASSPVPPKTWLDVDEYSEMRVVALEAIERAEWALQVRANLEKHYISKFFTIDLSAISARFRNVHTSVLRYLNPQYYLDCHTLRELAQPGAALRQSDLAIDVLALARLLTYEQWTQDSRTLHARTFGRYYQGNQTDWPKVRELLTWTDCLHSAFGGREVGEPVIRLVIGPANERGAIASVAHKLTEQVIQWRAEHGWMERILSTSLLVMDHADPDDAPHTSLSAALSNLHAMLNTFWRAADTLAATLRGPSSEPCSEMEADLIAAHAAHEYVIWMSQPRDDLRWNLGRQFQGLATDWVAAERNLEWTRAFIALYPSGVPATLAAWITAPSSDGEAAQDSVAIRATIHVALDQAKAAISAIGEESAQVAVAISRDALAGGPQSFDMTLLDQLRERTDLLRASLPQLKRWVDCNQAIKRCQALGLGPMVNAFLGRHRFPRDIVQIFERQFYTLWLDAARSEAPMLATFSGDNQSMVVRAFRDLDKEHIERASDRLVSVLRQRCYAAHALANMPLSRPQDREFIDAYAHLAREVEKKRHSAIREIVRRVGPALLELKPCWMMSPLSVSQFIETAEPIFDLVIFDEASQVLPEDAICAIMRGKQLIVVGDDKQLPPTSFFAKSLSDDGEDDDDGESAENERTESILQELMAANFASRSLKWHYRSRHESLIAFSNSEFYGDQLITFPGPAANHGEGVKFVYVADGVYDRSSSRTNRREAERVVDELFNIIERDQTSSIGVVALSAAQQSAFREALDNRFRKHPELAHARDRLNEESDMEDAFFIKNLETVQGDERDIIVLSIGYGRDSKGAIYRNFGPINREGGERRLNVAVTRARRHMIVVSSIHASDLPPTMASAGSRALRRYLDFAERGPVALLGAPTSVHDARAPEFDSPFEFTVYSALMAHGLTVDTQVGCSGYRIDLAIRDDQDRDHYLLGVECDGRTYHSSKTARDRDRLRQAHLEGLGWHIHRIWSSDWIADPEREIGKVLEALAHARMKTPIRQLTEGAG